MSAAVVPIRQGIRIPPAAQGIDLSDIDPIMFAQYLADQAKIYCGEEGTLRFALMIASALIAQFAEGSRR